MSAARTEVDRVATAAMIAAGAIIAHQVAGKATRDAVFLSIFDVALLPPMVIGAAVVSIVVAVITARHMARKGPGRLIPMTFTFSGALFLVEWGLLEVAPAVVAILLYLHLAAGGGVLISGFWSLVNERFDPHTAKKKIGRIAGGATLGGLIGGLLAERVGALAGTAPMFPLLAALHLFSAWRVLALRIDEPTKAAADDVDTLERSAFQVLAKMPYLRNLALLLTLTTIAAGLVDFVFKARASAAFASDDAGLLRFFALFYTGAGLLAFLGQTFLTRLSLERLGLARTVAILPASLLAVGGFALGFPGLIAATAMRGAEEVTRNSFFRSAYELLYTPVPRAAKRATKLIIDVGFDRLGDAAGAGIVATLLIAGPALAYPVLLGLAMVLGLTALLLMRSLHRGYVRALESSLVNQAEALDLDDVRDSTTRLTMLQTLGSLDVRGVVAAARKARGEAAPDDSTVASEPAPTLPTDPQIALITELRSGDRVRIERALRRPGLNAAAAAHVMALLAWDDIRELAVQALRGIAPRITGQLVDALLDPDEEFAIRRRLPRAIRDGDPERARAGLVRGLDDRRFEVRFQCGRALAALARKHEQIRFEKRDVYAVVARELEVSERVWAGHRLLDGHDSSDSLLADEMLASHVSSGLEHVFTLLSLVLPQRPVRVAFRGLHTDDPVLRGTALEYLDSALPESIRNGIRRVAQSDAQREIVDPSAETDPATRLLESMASIELNLEALRDRLKEPSDS